MSHCVLKHNEYDVGVMDFEAPQFSGNKKQMQSILFPTYEGGRSPLIQIPMIELEMYGIPSKSDYYKDDFQRMFLKLPLNQSIPEVKELTEGLLNKIDAKFGSAKVKDKLFGKKTKHTYQPLVRTPLTEDGKPNTERHPYMKIKLMTKYPTNEITTTIFKQMDDGKKIMLEGIKDIDEFAYYVRFKSKVKCIIQPSKLWITPQTASEPMYGIAFKLVKVLVDTPPLKVGGKIEFIDSESESEVD